MSGNTSYVDVCKGRVNLSGFTETPVLGIVGKEHCPGEKKERI